MNMIKKSIQILYFVSLFFMEACGQEKKQENINTNQEMTEANNCVFDKSNFVMAKTYPFDVADEIQVVSYPKSRESAEKYDEMATWQILLEDGKFQARGIQETITLPKEKWQTLFSILYDYIPQGKTSEIIECYQPKHAILFLQQKKVLAYIEISLGCNDVRVSKNVSFGAFCNEKMCKIQNLFKESGIKQGLLESCK